LLLSIEHLSPSVDGRFYALLLENQIIDARKICREGSGLKIIGEIDARFQFGAGVDVLLIKHVLSLRPSDTIAQ
jgi:hypothetical protein